MHEQSFVAKCPKEVAPFLHQILQVSVGFMKYDPNFAGDDDEGEKMELEEEWNNENDNGEQDEGNDDEEDGDYEDYGAGSDDDDGSWKVRKAAVKVVTAVISFSNSTSVAEGEVVLRTQLLQPWCIDALISRFNKEREENVRLDVLQAFNLLVQATLRIQSKVTVPLNAKPADNLQDILRQKMDLIVAASYTLLSGQAAKTKSAIFTLLRALIPVREVLYNSVAMKTSL